MELFQVEKYQKGNFFAPGDNIDPKAKDKKWFKEKAEFLYSQYLRDNCGIPYSRLVDFSLYRLYAQGRQPVEKYMNVLCPVNKKTGLRKMWMNISWDILSVAPKYRQVVLGRLSKIDYKAQCNCVDELSDEARNNLKFGIWVEKKHQEFLQMFDKITGTAPDPQQQEIPYMPDTMGELDMMANMGAFKLKHEIAMEKLTDAAFKESLWEEIKRKLHEDFYDLGVAAVKDFVDPLTQRAQTRYVDPANLVARSTRSNDYEDISEAGELKLFSLATISELTGMPEDEVRRIANVYLGYAVNKALFSNTFYQDRAYYNTQVLVLDMEFESADTRVFKNFKDKNGNEVTDERNFNYQPSDTGAVAKGDASINRISVKQWYRCKWIVGTDIIFDYGYQMDVPRLRKNKPCSSYHIYKIADKSMQASIIQPLDQIQFNYLKLQNDIAKAPPAGVRIEFGSLSNMDMGEGKMNPLEILSIYRQTGDLLYKRTTQNGQVVQGAENPIEELAGGLGRVLDERIKIFEFNFNMIRDITGVNQVVDASSPAPGALNGTSQIAANATDNVLQVFLHGYKNLKVATARNLCKRIQIISRFGDASQYYDIAGRANMEIIRLGAGNELADYGMYCEAAITDEQRDFVRQAALTSLNAAKQGAVGITMSDYLFIERALEADQIKYAQFFLAAREKQEYMKQQAMQQQNMQQNQQGAQQVEQMKSQAAAQQMQMQQQGIQQEIMAKFNADSQLAQQQHENKMKEITLEKNLEAALQLNQSKAEVRP
jgi:hypothetical protein